MPSLREFWENVHTRDDLRFLAGSNPLDVYHAHNIAHLLHPGVRIIEVGVGSGASIATLYSMGCLVTAVDIAATALNRVASIAQTVLTDSISSLEPQSRDLALIHLVLQHCDDTEVIRLLSGILPALVPGGLCSVQFAEQVSDTIPDWLAADIHHGIAHWRPLAHMEALITQAHGTIQWCSPPVEYPPLRWYFLHIST